MTWFRVVLFVFFALLMFAHVLQWDRGPNNPPTRASIKAAVNVAIYVSLMFGVVFWL